MSLWPALLRFWFQTNLGHENSASYLEIDAGKTFSCQGHALVTLSVEILCSDRSKFDRWVHAENWKIKQDLPVSWSLIEILSHEQGGRRSHEIAQRKCDSLFKACGYVRKYDSKSCLQANDVMTNNGWGMGGHVRSCLLGHVIESQSNFNLQVSLV